MLVHCYTYLQYTAPYVTQSKGSRVLNEPYKLVITTPILQMRKRRLSLARWVEEQY